MNSRIKAAGGIVIKDDKILFIKKNYGIIYALLITN